MQFKCKECGQEFDAIRSLHTHVKKHGILLGEYYVRNFRRKNKLTGELLPFKNYKDYFKKDFSQPHQLLEWCGKVDDEEAANYIGKLLNDKIVNKEYDHGPTNLELISSGLPSVDTYKKYFGSYTAACDKCGVEPLLNKNMPKEFYNDFSETKILIDTREQQPLKFKNSEIHKLDVGDYSVSSSDYDYTYVDRKSFGDFCSTVTVGYSRFCKELDRCRELGCYLFIVSEFAFSDMEVRNKKNFKKFKLEYVKHNMRDIQNKYKDCCQFVFSGSREKSQDIIPKVLVMGKQLWEVDVDYFWSKELENN